MEPAEQFVKLLAAIDRKKATHKLDAYIPYPFQEKFHHAEGFQTPGTLAFMRALICANQIGKCNSIRSRIETDRGEKALSEVWGKEINVLTWPDRAPRRVLKWVRKPPEECFRIEMADKRWIECSGGHRLLTSQGWLSISEILPFLPKSAVVAQGFRESVRRGVRRWFGTLRGYWDRCFLDSRLCGGRLLYDQEDAQVFAPLPNGVQQHNDHLCNGDEKERRHTNNLFAWFDHQSILCYEDQTSAQSASLVSQASLWRDLRPSDYSPSSWQFRGFGYLPREAGEASSRPFEISSDCGNEIVAVYPIGRHVLYDMEVEERQNYLAGGLVHHNTWCAGYEVAMHLTGQYPDWWKGHRFWYPVDIVVAGVTNDTTRDHIQKILLGEPDEGDRAIGTGTIPIEAIGKITRKAGVPNAVDSVLIKSKNRGNSKLQFKAYEMGFKKFMGKPRDVTWMDEEPPADILSQAVRSTFAKKRSTIMLTLTPEEGMTQVVSGFMNNLQKGQAIVTATWDDAPHMTPEVRANKLSSIPEHERDMRSKGTPLAGAGVIFNIPDEKIVVDPFEIPKHWPRGSGMDFGWDHPFGAAELAWDRDADVIYVIADYREQKVLPAVHASAVNKWGEWIPVFWPHDGLNTEKGTGEALIDQYRLAHVNVWHEKASNPPAPGDEEGKGGNSVEAPLMEMLERMHTGRWKVFKTCRSWLEEKRMYHRDLNMKIVKYADDVISASRYAYMMRRHWQTQTFNVRRNEIPLGARNWT